MGEEQYSLPRRGFDIAILCHENAVTQWDPAESNTALRITVRVAGVREKQDVISGKKPNPDPRFVGSTERVSIIPNGIATN